MAKATSKGHIIAKSSQGAKSDKGLLAFYNGEEVKDQFKTLDIDGILDGGNGTTME